MLVYIIAPSSSPIVLLFKTKRLLLVHNSKIFLTLLLIVLSFDFLTSYPGPKYFYIRQSFPDLALQFLHSYRLLELDATTFRPITFPSF